MLEPSSDLWWTFFLCTCLSMKHWEFEFKTCVHELGLLTASFTFSWSPEAMHQPLRMEPNAGWWKSFLWGISDFLEVKTQAYNLKDTWLWCSVVREWSVLYIISISSSWFSAELSVRSLRSSVGQICFLIVCPFCGHSELNCWLRARDFLKWIVVDFIGCCPLCAGLCIGPFIYIVLCTHGSPHWSNISITRLKLILCDFQIPNSYLELGLDTSWDLCAFRV